jgi:two-component system, NtrC family, nitrogen regulation response regulator NtrX
MIVLIVDDNKEFSSTLADIVGSFGYETKTVHSPADAFSFTQRFHKNIGLAMLDIEYSPEETLDGLDILEHIRKNYPSIPVVMISGKGTIETAVRATKLGAVNFIEKSIVSKEKIRNVLQTSLASTDKKGEAEDIRKFLAANGIIGKSKAMLSIGDNIIRYGRTDLNVLITGETGTGKKLVAKALHAASRRAKHPFVTVDIPNIPKELFQSELFGHIRGSFSGATETKKGLFHEANKGSIFLDEIGEMTLDLQSNLFIPIEEKVVRRVGSVTSEEVDIRFVSATDMDLMNSMREGKFREQLYHRLRECEISIPPLSERREDIYDIIEYYVKKHNDDFEESKFFSPSAVEFLCEQTWHGNVRELASVIRVAMQTVQNEQVEVSEINKIIHAKSSFSNHDRAKEFFSDGRTLKEDLAEVDKKKIESILQKCNGNVSKSAAMLGISRETLHNKIRRYDVDVQMFRVKPKRYD